MTLGAPSVPAPEQTRERRSPHIVSLLLAVCGVGATVVGASLASESVRSWWWVVAVVGCSAALTEFLRLSIRSRSSASRSRPVSSGVEGGRRPGRTATVPDRPLSAPPVPRPEADLAIDSSSIQSGRPSAPASVRPDASGQRQGWACDALALPKSSYTVDEAEDAWAVDGSTRTAALSDGASSSFMAREWAQVLATSYLSAPLDHVGVSLRPWLADATARWSSECSGGQGQWWVGESVQRGSHATLLGLRLTPSPRGGQWDASAVGDSCLVHLGPSPNGYRRLVAFPIDHHGAFDRHPDLLSTASEDDADVPVLRRVSGEYRSGDVFLLLSDAIAEWALANEPGVDRVWDQLVGIDQADFVGFVDRQRSIGTLHDDDTTVIRIRTGLR